jgi:acyl-CoA-binding protein
MTEQIEINFNEAVNRVKSLSYRPSDTELLELYALFKQSTEGDVKGKRPGLLDFKGRAKYDAWSKIMGLNASEAKQRYVDLVARLFSSR